MTSKLVAGVSLLACQTEKSRMSPRGSLYGVPRRSRLAWIGILTVNKGRRARAGRLSPPGDVRPLCRNRARRFRLGSVPPGYGRCEQNGN
jgi:hypothetical protein